LNPLVPKTLSIVALALASTLTAAQTAQPLTPPCKAAASQPNLFPAQTPVPCRTQRATETSISLGAFPQLTAARIVDTPNDFATESSSPSAGVLGTLRQSFSPWLGYSLNMGYTRASERATNNSAPGSPNLTSNVTVPADVYEISLSYLAEKHLTPRLSGFADIGAGMLTFLPEHRGSPATDLLLYGVYAPSVTFHPLGVGGVGIDYLLTPHMALRAEYRGQLYKFADYGSGLPRYLTVTSEPTVSLVYNFHTRKP